MESLPKVIQDLLAMKDKRIRELQEKIRSLTKENTIIINNFRASTDALLERIKELESTSSRVRPQTANILKQIGILAKNS